MPIKAYEDIDVFKLYMLDVGILGVKTIIDGNNIFTEFKGSLTEQYVLQQLKNNFSDIYYWTSKSYVAEIDFIVQIEDYIVPIEVKATKNLKAKSLQQYIKDYLPNKSIRTSLADYKVNDSKLYDIPLYAINNIDSIIKKDNN